MSSRPSSPTRANTGQSSTTRPSAAEAVGGGYDYESTDVTALRSAIVGRKVRITLWSGVEKTFDKVYRHPEDSGYGVAAVSNKNITYSKGKNPKWYDKYDYGTEDLAKIQQIQVLDGTKTNIWTLNAARNAWEKHQN